MKVIGAGDQEKASYSKSPFRTVSSSFRSTSSKAVAGSSYGSLSYSSEFRKTRQRPENHEFLQETGVAESSTRRGGHEDMIEDSDLNSRHEETDDSESSLVASSIQNSLLDSEEPESAPFQGHRIESQKVPILPEVDLLRRSNEIPAIPLAELNGLTSSFGQKALIGEGSYSHVFYATLSTRESVALKKLDPNASQESDIDFVAQLSTVSRLKNDYFVQLLGYCLESNNQILVYKFATHGSLHDILHGRKGVQGVEPDPVLSWGQRLKIAYGAARGHEYLHEKVQPPIIHRKEKISAHQFN